MYERLHQLAIYSMQLHFLQKNDLDNANERVYIRLSPFMGNLDNLPLISNKDYLPLMEH